MPSAPKYQLAGLVRAGRAGRNIARSGANVLKGFTPVIDFAATTFAGAPTGMFTNMGRFADVIRPNYTAPTEDQVINLNPSANSLTKFSSIGGLFSKPDTRHSYLPFTRKGRANILKRYYDAIGYRPPYMGFRQDFVARDYQSPGFLTEGSSISPSTVFEKYRNPTTFASVAKALPRTADFFVRSSNPKNPMLFGTDGTASRQQVLRSNSFLINQGVTNKPFVFLHGSGSSALPSISRFGGLVPTGQLIERGGAPFAGSLQVLRDWNTAHADHQNRRHISLGMIDSPSTPLNYAFQRPLTNNFVEKYNEFLRGESQYSTRNDSRYEGAPLKEIFERRTANFENAPLAEQKVILDNFPVVFGLNPIKNSMGTARYRLGKGRYDLAPSLAGGATFDEMATAFVPRNRIDVTRQYLPGVDVMPLEQFLINMPLMQKYAFGPKLDNKYFKQLQDYRSWFLYNLEKDRLSSPQGRYNPDFRQNGGTTSKYQGFVGGALRAGRAGRQLSLFPKVIKPLVNPITTTQNLGKQLSFNFNAPSVAVQTYNQPLTFNAPNLTDIPGARDLSFLMDAPAGSDFGKFRQKLYDFRTSNYKPSGDPEYLNFMVNKQPNSLGRYSDYDIPREFNYLTELGLRDYNTRAGQVALHDYATKRSKLYNTIFSDFKYSPDGTTMYMKSPEDFRRPLDVTDPRYQDVLQQLRERVNALDLSFDPNIVGKTSSPLILHRGTRGDMVNVVDPSDFSIKLKRLSEVGDDEIFFSTGFTSTFDPAMPTFRPPTVQKTFGKNDHLRIYNPSGSTVLSPALHMTDIQWPGEGETLLPRFSFFQKAKSFPFKASNLERSNEISGGAFNFNPPTTDLINLGFIRQQGGKVPVKKHQGDIPMLDPNRPISSQTDAYTPPSEADRIAIQDAKNYVNPTYFNNYVKAATTFTPEKFEYAPNRVGIAKSLAKQKIRDEYMHVDPDIKDPTYRDFFYDSEVFTENWLNSPQYKKMLKESTDSETLGDYYRPEYDYDYLNEGRRWNFEKSKGNQFIKNNLNMTPWEMYTSPSAGVAASSLSYRPQTIYRKPADIPILSPLWTPETALRTAAIHELSHATDRPLFNGNMNDRDNHYYLERLIPFKDVELIEDLALPKDEVERNFIYNMLDPTPMLSDQVNYEYFTDPTEARARLSEVRALLAREGKDVFNYDITMDDLDKARRKYVPIQGLPANSNYRSLMQLISTFGMEGTLQLLNTISQAEPQQGQQQMFYGQEGGGATKHQQTTTPNFVSLRDTPKATSENRRRRLKSNINPFAV